MILRNSFKDKQLIDALKHGEVCIIPTDTTYGLVARAGDPAAVEQLYETKKRESKPGTIIAASLDQLVDLGIPRRYLTAVEHFWPNPVSVIVPTGPDMAYLDKGLMSLAVRIPADEELKALLEQTGALMTTSANHPGKPVAMTIGEAQKYFGDKVTYYVDGGDLSGREASTIIRVIDDEIEVVRQGALKLNDEHEIMV